MGFLGRIIHETDGFLQHRWIRSAKAGFGATGEEMGNKENALLEATVRRKGVDSSEVRFTLYVAQTTSRSTRHATWG